MKRLLPYLLTILIFSTILVWSRPSHKYINTHDEDDNVVSGYLMSNKGLILGRDIFTHHLPGAYLISEQIEDIFQPESVEDAVFVHRSFTAIWNFVWAVVLLSIFGPKFLWLTVITELLRASYLYSLFQAENLVVYPMIYLILSLFTIHPYKPLILGIASGLVTVLLSPLWPLILISGGYFLWTSRYLKKDWVVFLLSFLLPVVLVLIKIDFREFLIQFFGYNTLTYAPMVMKKPMLYTLAAFLAPGISLFDFSFSAKMVVIQLLVLFLFVFDLKRIGFKKWLLFGILLGIIGFRRTPRFNNEGIDFHVLPWVTCLATLCWYKYFYEKVRFSKVWVIVFLLPLLIYFIDPAMFFPTREQAGKMVIRYDDSNPIVSYLKRDARTGDTLFTLPAHTLLYRQTDILPFNKFLFYLPWMEQSPILFSQLKESFRYSLPTYIFIDSMNFPYDPPEIVENLLSDYEGLRIDPNQPLVYKLRLK